MGSTKELIVQGKQWMFFSRWAPHLEEGTDTLPRVGELARGGNCCHTGDPLSTGPGDPRPNEPSGKTWVQRVAWNSWLVSPSVHREEEELKALWPCVMFCFFSVSPVSTLYLNYLSFL